MGTDLLGKHFDIHGGGQDLQFPHHENEIAQSEGAMTPPTDPHGHDCQYVNYWMHNGFIRVDDEKMSKSLGNFFTIRDVLKSYDAEVVRFFILRAHYRSPLNYSDAHLDDARGALTRLYTALKNHPATDSAVDWNEPHAQRFAAAMNDDFGTSEAIAVLFDLANLVNRDSDVKMANQLRGLAGVLGLLQRDAQAFLQSVPAGTDTADGLSNEAIDALIVARVDAKKAKNFAESDRIRDELKAAGIVLEDKPGGLTEWRRA
jgi:cysteinyl-tRNA synthetase